MESRIERFNQFAKEFEIENQKGGNLSNLIANI